MKKRPNPTTVHTQWKHRGAQTTSHSSALVWGQSTQFIANSCHRGHVPKRGYISAILPPIIVLYCVLCMAAEVLHESVFCRRRTQTVKVCCSVLLYSCSVCCSVLYYVLCKATEIHQMSVHSALQCVLQCVTVHCSVCCWSIACICLLSKENTDSGRILHSEANNLSESLAPN